MGTDHYQHLLDGMWNEGWDFYVSQAGKTPPVREDLRSLMAEPVLLAVEKYTMGASEDGIFFLKSAVKHLFLSVLDDVVEQWYAGYNEAA